jgi:CBS domain-containing protein
LSSQVEEFLGRAAAESAQLNVRELLAIWGYKARTYESVARIQRDLSAAGLRCDPDLSAGGGDSVVRVGAPVSTAETEADAPTGGEEIPEQQDERLQLPPVALLVRHIASAIGGIVSVRPDETLEKAQALMSAHDYSQLAVMSGTRDLDGAVSWRSIARAGLSKSQITLADATVSLPKVVHANDDLLGQIEAIYRNDFVFVRDEDQRISGIITAADLTVKFRNLTEPFFQLGEIEGRLRRCIDRVFGAEELRAATGDKKLDSAENMTFWQYKQLLDDDTRWKRMGWHVDRETFIDYLEAARKVRNRVMHFGEELSPEDKRTLVQCLNFMRALDPLP